MDAAQTLLNSLRDYSLPLAAYVVMAPLVTYLKPSNVSLSDKTAKLVFVGMLIVFIEISFFFLAEGRDLIRVATFHPSWGCLVSSLILIALVAIAKWCLENARTNRRMISFTANVEAKSVFWKMSRMLYVIGAGIWLVAFVVAIVWLKQIANGQ